MKVTMEKLGITASYSRPRVSNDLYPFSEDSGPKYRPDWPTKGFATKADAQAWVKSFASWYNGTHLDFDARHVGMEDSATPQTAPFRSMQLHGRN